MVSTFFVLEQKFSRRNILQLMGSSGLMLYLSGPEALARSLANHASSNDLNFEDISPFDNSFPGVASRSFFGENISRIHPHLWDLHKFDKEMGTKERQRVVVVGGGLSGLASAYLLREFKPIVLEQSERFGGNAKGQIWNGIRMPFGSAYFTRPTPGTKLFKLYRELGISNSYKFKTHAEPVAIDNKMVGEYWDSVGNRIPQWEIIDKFFSDVAAGKNGQIYPEIPSDDESVINHVNELDKYNFKDYIEEKVLKTSMHPEVLGYFDYYFLGAFSAKCNEISAAAGINFYAAEEGFCVLDGGNANIAERLMKKLITENGRQTLRANELVIGVGVKSNSAYVKTLNLNTQKINTIECESVVMSCPKFVVGKILHGIESDRSEAIKKLRYRSYLVANLLVKKYIKPDFYEKIMFRGKDFKKAIDPKEFRRATDIVHGDYLNSVKGNFSALTLYRPVAYDGARSELIKDGSYEKIRAEFEHQIANEVLPIMKLSQEDVFDLRIFRIGHALPLSEPGLLRNKVCENITRPFAGRVFFVEQDNWALPSWETCASEAFTWAPKVKKVLSKV